jgi:hypothetical protein
MSRFTNDFTRETHLYLLKKKSEVFGIYRDYKAWCHVQRNVPIKILRSDRGGEYLGEVFIRHLKAAGTVQNLLSMILLSRMVSLNTLIVRLWSMYNVPFFMLSAYHIFCGAKLLGMYVG